MLVKVQHLVEPGNKLSAKRIVYFAWRKSQPILRRSLGLKVSITLETTLSTSNGPMALESV